MRTRTIIIPLVLVVAVPFLLYWFYFRNPYSNLVVGEMQVTTTKINGVEYVFGKEGDMLSILPYDESHYPRNVIYHIEEGKTYQWLDIDITVVEVHPDRFVLSLRSRS